jgi:hypothetical protein
LPSPSTPAKSNIKQDVNGNHESTFSSPSRRVSNSDYQDCKMLTHMLRPRRR